MHVQKAGVLDLFETKRQFEIPLFQRQYVWNQRDQWEPLWEDISRQLTHVLSGQAAGPVHFLGAMVLNPKQVPTMDVERRQVIDGQQRLTTLQLFLAALRDICAEHGCTAIANEFRKYTLNDGIMTNPEVEKFKVLPTQSDRQAFADAMTAGSARAVMQRYPAVRGGRQREHEARPQIVEAYLYFDKALREYFIGDESAPPIRQELTLSERFARAFRALKGALVVVLIDLATDDDPQVIFETLNARGEPLLPVDLVRNNVFLRIGRDGGDAETLYRQYWRDFDEKYWRKEVTQGRLKRPRSDMFMQHFLACQTCNEVPVKHLYVEYRHWIEHTAPFTSVSDELACIAQYRDYFRRILNPTDEDPIEPIAAFMERFDIRTAYPLLLHLLSLGLQDSAWRHISSTLESYLLRRALLGWTSSGYNRVFLTLLRNVRGLATEELPNRIEAELSGLTGPSAAWPSDEQFADAWMNGDAYSRLKGDRLTHIFRRLDQGYHSRRTEVVRVASELSIEHLMPQEWHQHWPLQDGTFAESSSERDDAGGSLHAAQVRNRNQKIHTIGNLTILTQSLNATISNQGWQRKRAEILASSVLPINLQLRSIDVWDEATIERRGRELLGRALAIWPRSNPSRQP